MITPRPYQIEAVDAVFRRWSVHDSTLVVAATGVGKSAIAAMIAAQVSRDRRFLVLVNRTELLRQFKRTLEAMCPDDVVEIECGESYATHPSENNGETAVCGRIVVAMMQTLADKKRLLRWHPTEFSHIIWDENQHAVITSRQTNSILGHFRDFKLCGLTATPDRLDGVSLAGYFKSVAYNYDILSAIRDGWLVNINQVFEEIVGWDLSQLKRVKGDFAIGELDRIARQEKPSQAIASGAIKWSEIGGQRKPCLIFAVSVDHGRLIAEILNRHRSGCAIALDGKIGPEVRREHLDRFRAGQYQYLVGADLFLEGFDDDSIQVVVMGRPTQSRARYSQALGRATRPHFSIVDALNAAKTAEKRRLIIRESVKPHMTCVDMVGVSAHHKLVTSADILGGWLPRKVRDEAVEIIRDGLGKPDVNEALERAILKLDEKEKARRARVIMNAFLESREVNPFDLTDIRPKREPMVLRGKKPTDRQLAFLDRYDVPSASVKSFWDAKILIDGIAKKRDEGPPSPKQAELLSRFGFEPERMNWKQAKEAIDKLAQEGWKRVESLA